MSDAVKSETYKGHVIETHVDSNPLNPRKDRDNMGTIVYWHTRYTLGEVDGRKEYPDQPPQELADKLTAAGAVLLPLYLMDHSGLALSTTSAQFRACDPTGWDWGPVGFIYVGADKIRKEYGVTRISAKVRELAEGALRAEVAEFATYLAGEVYGYVVLDPDGKHADSCWGYYGHEDSKGYMIQCAKDAVDSHIAAQHEQATLCACVI